jgi:hypothetical protein
MSENGKMRPVETILRMEERWLKENYRRCEVN